MNERSFWLRSRKISIFLILIVGVFLIYKSITFVIYKNTTMPKIENFEVQEFKTEKEEILVGIISDTHGKILPKEVKEIFKNTDLIIHTGDILNLETLEELEKIAPLFAVVGNEDSPEIKEKLPTSLSLKIFNFKISAVHSSFSFWLGSHFNLTQKTAAEKLTKKENFDILIFGHTHRSYLKELNFDEKKVLLINPGSPTAPFLSKPSVAILKIDKESFKGEIIYLKK